ncbi:cytochrome P450 [Sphingobium sp.]|uniref:cytochrome P450 n=1 Tax=Sphingobium sp. TaxID=1912891 RepID=UPI0039C95519
MTSRDTELGGVHLPAGQRVFLAYAAANRDPRCWADPDRFDIGREAGGHLAFGHGVHSAQVPGWRGWRHP